jgi:L-proline amide hydrolase
MIPFEVPGQSNIKASTYYKVFGDLSTGVPPVVVLHGGPGGGHDYLLSFAELWPQYGLPVILYDQIGCGSSTHLPHTAGDKAFWQEALFVAELNNLLDHLNLRDGPGFHILGQSWGGMLGAAFASTRPRGLRRLVLASALASKQLSIDSLKLRREELPPDTQMVLQECEQKGDYNSPAYQEAWGVFQKMFLCRTEPYPPELISSLKNLTDDKTVYGTM